MDPRQSWIQSQAGFEKLYREGHLQVPSTSAFGRALEPSDIQTSLEATQLGFMNVPGVQVDAPIRTDANTLFEAAYNTRFTSGATPGKLQGGVCPICGEYFPTSLTTHLFLGPHARSWVVAVAGGGALTLIEWRCLFVVFFANELVNRKAFITAEQYKMLEWVLSQKDRLLQIKESADTPVYPMPRPDQVTPGLEYLLSSANTLNYWAMETSCIIVKWGAAIPNLN